jgi:hypothetical protein
MQMQRESLVSGRSAIETIGITRTGRMTGAREMRASRGKILVAVVTTRQEVAAIVTARAAGTAREAGADITKEAGVATMREAAGVRAEREEAAVEATGKELAVGLPIMPVALSTRMGASSGKMEIRVDDPSRIRGRMPLQR